MMRIVSKQNTDGYVMVLVLVVMTFITVLCLMLLMSASMLLGSVRNAGGKEQCRILAVSLSGAIGEQIESFSYSEPPDPDPDYSDTSLSARLETVATESWEPGEVISYQLESDGLPGITTVELYWLDISGHLAGVDFADDIDMAEAAKAFGGVRLYVTVTNTMNKDASSVIAVYRPVIDIDIIEGDPESEDIEIEVEDIEVEDDEAETVWIKWYWEYAGSSWEGEVR